MKRSMGLVIAATLAVLAALPATAQMRALSDPVVAHPDPESLFISKDKHLNRNKQAALRIMRELLQCNQWDRSGEWLSDKYIQHNPMAASGLAGVKRYFIEVAKRKPTPTCTKLTSPVVAVQAEGDFVTVLTVREFKYADDPTKGYTTTWFDTWRFVDGKADEHWDPATLPVPPPAASAQAARPASALVVGSAEDRAAIEKLMWSYDRALDSYDPDVYVTKFTADGAFGQTKGHDALHKMVADLRKGRDDRVGKGEKVQPMRHFTMNQYLEFTGPTTARYHYYHQTVFGTGGPAGSPDAPRVAAAGNGVDDLVKVDGQWLIKFRNVAAADDK